MQNKNSLLYWYKKIKNLDIPQPETRIILLNFNDIDRFWDTIAGNYTSMNPLSNSLLEKIYYIANELGYPLFFRTDMSSYKHNWENATLIQNKEHIRGCITQTIEFHMCYGLLGLPFNALVFRKYIPLQSTFTAFRGKLPIAKERRYFINKGQIQCHHPYWSIESIDFPNIKDWREKLIELNKETEKEIKHLSDYALKVAKIFDGNWSIDFALSKEGIWYLIDMALGGDSYHHIECQYCSEEMRKFYLKRIEERKRRRHILEQFRNNKKENEKLKRGSKKWD